MSDPRLTPANPRVAHISLQGQVEAERFVEGDWRQVAADILPLLSAPDGKRERELIMGEGFCVLEETPDGFAFGFTRRDGYVGWVFADYLAPDWPHTHRVSAARSFWQELPDIKQSPRIYPLPFGARLQVVETRDTWARFRLPTTPGTLGPVEGWIPKVHISPLDQSFSDPIAVAELFLGTPYVWGGNSSFGIDCSGLVQAALLACGTPCPGDSDLQMALGEEVTGDLERGDLIFWKGHVALVVDEARIIHANANDMAVAYEGTDAAIARIEAQGGGKVLARRRIAM